MSVQFSCPVISNFATPWTEACQASLSITNSWSLLKLTSIALMMPSNHLILCHPLILLPSIFPSISSLHQVAKVLELHSASASVLPMNSQDWFPLGLTGFYLLAVQGTQESPLTPLFKSINSLALSFLYGPTLPSIHDYWKNHSFDYADLCQQSIVSAL